jgi:hypothetical protein
MRTAPIRLLEFEGLVTDLIFWEDSQYSKANACGVVSTVGSDGV